MPRFLIFRRIFLCITSMGWNERGVSLISIIGVKGCFLQTVSRPSLEFSMSLLDVFLDGTIVV